jgi:hypothetical protein
MLRGRVPVTIGIGSGFVKGENVDVAIADPAEIPSGCGGRRLEARIWRTPVALLSAPLPLSRSASGTAGS